MKSFLAILIFCGLINITSNVATQPAVEVVDTRPAKIAREIVDATVLIHSFQGGFGSGVVVYQDQDYALIATALHVLGKGPINLFAFSQVDKNGKIRTLFPNDQLQLVKKDEKLDLALIKTTPYWTNHASMFSDKTIDSLENYTECLVAGFPAVRASDPPHTVHITYGLICALEGRENMRISAPIFFGNSGGGVWVLNNGRYKLAGLVHSVHSLDRTRAHIIPHIGEATEPKALIKFIYD